jgi:hypothetical protein
MSGLLNRLASQALGATSARSNNLRIRPATHAPMPAQQAEREPPVPSLSDFHELPTEDPAHERAVRGVAGIELPRPNVPTPAEPVDRRQEAASSLLFHSRPIPRIVERAAATTLVPSRPEVDEIESRVPRPLLGDASATPAQPSTLKPLPPVPLHIEPARRPPAAEPTEVHVHIGRVEVVTMPEPAANSKRPRPPARNTRPLAEYLARQRHP